MKNIHIIPTDKPSRLYLHSDNELQLRTNIIRTSEDYLGSNQHIYITSDEEIKYDEYYLGEDNNIYCLVTTVNYNGKKIILTTDQDLIEDGVQAIDGEFLEWFVNNPSCEEVEVFQLWKEGTPSTQDSYQIIIPKEESYPFGLPKALFDDVFYESLEPKQETTLDESAEKYAKMMWGVYYDDTHPDIAITQTQGEITVKDFIAGAEWQQERMYSEEEVLQLLLRLQQTEFYDNLYDWFEQFKKK